MKSRKKDRLKSGKAKVRVYCVPKLVRHGKILLNTDALAITIEATY